MILDGKKKTSIDRAVELIRAGDVVAFPTETVYGLGADALNAEAVEKIFQVKGRPESDPLIVHIADQTQLRLVAREIPDTAFNLISRFWPGPLTLVLAKSEQVPPQVTAGMETVAVRMPRNLIALALIKNSNRVIAAPSANRFQSISPTTAKDVEKELGERIPLILDGGPCQVGVESTVLSLVGEPTLLRPGGISIEDLEEALGGNIRRTPAAGDLPKASPGMLDFHYAPQKPLGFYSEAGLEKVLKGRGSKKALSQGVLICFSKAERKKFEDAGFAEMLVLSPRGNFDEAAQNLYGMLRKADEGPWRQIYALKCPEERLGHAINDTLKQE
jgi:L-threonylcarbamoyladenylate synthase